VVPYRISTLGVLVSGLLGWASGPANAAVMDAPLDAIGGVSFNPLVIPTVGDITVSPSPLIGQLLVSSGDPTNTYAVALAEYRLSGIDYARVRSAKLVGNIYANNAINSGVRNMNLLTYRGDGVITANDVFSTTTSNPPTISYQPPAQTVVGFERQVGQSVRQMRREGATHLGMGIVAANRQDYSALNTTNDPVRLEVDVVDQSLRNIAPVIPGNTGVSFFSEPGHWVGDGTERVFTPADASITFDDNFDNGISVSILTTDASSQLWGLDLSAPNEQQIGVGVYNAATRFAFNDPAVPGLSFRGNGRGLNTLTGRFEVLDIAYNAQGDLTRLNAVFEQIDTDSGNEALYGRVLFNVPEPGGVASAFAFAGLALCRRRSRKSLASAAFQR